MANEVGGAVASAVDLEFLESLDRNGLMRLLEPYRVALQCCGVVLGADAIGLGALRRLHSVLAADAAMLIAEVDEAFREIALLSTDEAHEVLIGQAAARQIDVFEGGPFAKQNLALRCYLQHRELFEAAHAEVLEKQCRTFVIHFGNGQGEQHGALESVLPRVRERLTAAFRKRNRAAVCEVSWQKLVEGMSMTVRHSGIPRQMASLHDGKRSVLQVTPEVEDIILYDEKLDRLSINSQSAADRELYRSVLGEVLAGDPSHYRVWPLLCGQPLLEEGSGLVHARDFPGRIESVVLRAIEVVGIRGAPRIVLGDKTGGDIGAELDYSRQMRLLEGTTVTEWTLGFVLSGESAVLSANCVLPSTLRVDARLSVDLLRDWLRGRRMFVPPM